MASKLHYGFKSYDDFAELVNFSCWWSCIGKGLRAMDTVYVNLALQNPFGGNLVYKRYLMKWSLEKTESPLAHIKPQ